MISQRNIIGRCLRFALLVALALAMVPGSKAAPAHAATTNTLFLKVISARTEPLAFDGAGVNKGDAATTYKWIINQDNVGDPSQDRFNNCYPYLDPGVNQVRNPDYPDKCSWPSIRSMVGQAPTVAQGTEADLDETHGLDLSTLPAGNYLISVLADGYKLDGAHFSLPLADSGLVTVVAQPTPLPAATVRIQVFEDNAPVNSAPDVPAEVGLAGFRGILNDVLGQVSTDVFGNPICTEYVMVDGKPDSSQPIPGTGGNCYSDADGVITIPNIGPNRYTAVVVPPDTDPLLAAGQQWVQTTTLEGNKDYDTWVQEGATGYDTEFAVAGEPFPATIFGFVKTTSLGAAVQQPTTSHGTETGEIKGSVAGVHVYVPLQGGLPYNGALWGGSSGAKIDKPVENPWIALSDLQNGDQSVYLGQGDANGNFDIKHVPDGSYTLTYWDDNQNYMLDLVNVTVRNGQVEDTGVLFLTGWWSTITGKVCNDLNSNGKCDTGEPGISNFTVASKRRTNSLMDRGSISVFTDSQGNYSLDNLYPLTQWLVIEAYSNRYYTNGVTWQTDNQPDETTILGSGVDVNVLPIIGQSGRLDWALKPYDATGRNGGPRNGGIVGTVSYDTTRNELDPRYAFVENWQPGVPGLDVKLYAPISCVPVSNPDPACVKNPNGGIGYYKVDTSDGSLAKGPLLNTYITESWQRPKNCLARDVNMQPVQQLSLPTATGDFDCLEAPLMGTQFGTFPTEDGGTDFAAAVDGNYGFGTILKDPVTGADIPETAMPAGDYLVEVEVPNDQITGRPLYKFTREEDINVFSGDAYTPQVPPPACVGPKHVVDVQGIGADGPNATYNPTFADMGGTIYEGQSRPLCNMKFVTLNNGVSIAPTFNVFTDVPLPGRFFGYTVDDLNISTNPRDLFFGEKRGIDNVPMGIYDYTDRLVTTVNTDPNGVWEVLLPSSDTISCPTPSGVCANLYRSVGNDPGTPGHLNPNYNPVYRTIGATFEIFAGDIVPADNAPTTIGVSIQAPGSQLTAPAKCDIDPAQPRLFTVSKPYIYASDTGTARDITIIGQSFGATQGVGKVILDGSTLLTVNSWTDRQLNLTIPATVLPGIHQLSISADNGFSTVNGITFHVIGGSYTPTVFEVGPGKTFDPTLTGAAQGSIQKALDAAANLPQALVVVYPGGLPDSGNPSYNPQKAYFENLLINSPVKLQGVGPGGVYSDGTTIDGSIIDGSAFGSTPLDPNAVAPAAAWTTKLATLTWSGDPTVPVGSTITILGQETGTRAFSAAFQAAIDGFAIQGGNQQGFPNNINVIGGTPTGQPAAVDIQGGGIYAHAYANNLQITNNILRSNGGAYGGAIRLGTPNLAATVATAQYADNNNNNVRIVNNRIISNGGTNLAGAVGLFNGSDNYEIAANDLCGNFSAEYGGAISHYGYNPNGKIHDNRIWFNQSYDEAGGIMIAGELPADVNALSPGAGPVDIYNNRIQANLSNDDGGGVRLLMAGNFPYNIYNNMIVNNISTHEGGGIALDDAPNVRIFNNTIMKNITTATAATSNGQPAPAGISAAQNSNALRATLPGNPIVSPPVLFNNILWDNRAGSWDLGSISGIGLQGDPNPVRHWDLGIADGSGSMTIINSLLQSVDADQPVDPAIQPNVNAGGNIVGQDPQIIATYDTSVLSFPWRGNPGVVGSTIVAVDLPPNLMGDYHLQGTSPAKDMGASAFLGVNAPAFDIDQNVRPAFGGYDAGADEIRATTANLTITKSDGVSQVAPGSVVHYTIVTTNLGPDEANLAPVIDTLPVAIASASWSCSASAGSSCADASGSGNINTTVSLRNGGTATFVVDATVGSNLNGGMLNNTATIAVPVGTVDSVPSNNSATDSDLIAVPLPTLGLLDNFNRTGLNNFGNSWSQVTSGFLNTAALRINNNQAFANSSGAAYWNGANSTYGAIQGAAFVFANTPANGASLVLKASGGTNSVPVNYIRVQYQTTSGNQVVVSTTNNGNVATPTFTNWATIPATFATNDVLSAVAYGDGTVNIYKTSGATVTELGSVVIPTSGIGAWTQGTGGGRIGMQLATNSRTDNFSGGGPIAPPPTLPALTLLDNFNRANANNLGTNWSQSNTAIRISVNTAIANGGGGSAYWNGTGTPFGARQGAAFTLAGSLTNNDAIALILKASGGTNTSPTSYIRVQYQSNNGGQVTIGTTTNSGGTITIRTTLATSLAVGDTLSAIAIGDGTVYVYKTSGATTTFVGAVTIPISGANSWAPGANGGRMGIQLSVSFVNQFFNLPRPNIDNFKGATVP